MARQEKLSYTTEVTLPEDVLVAFVKENSADFVDYIMATDRELVGIYLGNRHERLLEYVLSGGGKPILDRRAIMRRLAREGEEYPESDIDWDKVSLP